MGLLTEDLQKALAHDGSVVKVLSAIVMRGQLTVGLTISELARHANVGVREAEHALTSLEGEGILTITPVGTKRKLLLPQYKLVIPFSFMDTDGTRIKLLETELQKARRRVDDKTSGITEAVNDEEHALVEMVERDRGAGLSPTDAYFLGKGIAHYGPARIKAMYLKNRTAKDPLRLALYLLGNGASGKKADERGPQKVYYPEVD